MVGSYLDDRFVYDITRAFFENIEDFHAASALFKDISLQNALPEKGHWIPFHPGRIEVL